MFSELLARAETQYSHKHPFVVYRKPNETDVYAIFQNDGKLNHIFDYSESGFAFAPFDSKKPAVLLKEDEKLVASDFIGNNEFESKEDIAVTPNLQQPIYMALVQKSVENISNGQFKKVVLSRKIEVELKNSPFEILKSILSKYPTAFCYLWYHPKIGLWLGATPEILLSVENNQFTTMSLAGTQAAKMNENPVWTKKELEEQSLVTEYIQDALGTIVSKLQTNEPESVRAGNLWHLRTKISGRLQSSIVEIIKVLHPTPAVCGLPMKESQKFIVENEAHDREYYTGFLGELNMRKKKERVASHRNIENSAYSTIKKETQLFVNLRCMQIQDKILSIYVGGGITQDSDPESEWEETVQKSRTMLSVLNKN